MTTIDLTRGPRRGAATRRRLILLTAGPALVAVAVLAVAASGGDASGGSTAAGPTAEAVTRDLATTLTGEGTLQRSGEQVVSHAGALSPGGSAGPDGGDGTRSPSSPAAGDGGAGSPDAAVTPASMTGDGDGGAGSPDAAVTPASMTGDEPAATSSSTTPSSSTSSPSTPSSTTSTTTDPCVPPDAPTTTTSTGSTSTTECPPPSTTTTSTTAPPTTSTTAPSAGGGSGTGGDGGDGPGTGSRPTPGGAEAPGRADGPDRDGATLAPGGPDAGGGPAPAGAGVLPGGGVGPGGPSGGDGGADGDAPDDAVLTGLADIGTTAGRGTVLYTADDEPVVSLIGDLPAWRTLDAGVDDGPDVRQLEENLVALGHGAEVDVDETYTADTAAAVEAWETALGRTDPDGVVTIGDVVFLAAPGDILGHEASVGDTLAPGSPVLSVGSEQRVVVAPVDAADASGWTAGSTVELEWADGTTARGTVFGTGREVTDGRVDLVVAVDAAATGDRRSGVEAAVTLVDAHREGVVAVPVSAIVDDDGASAVRVARSDGPDEVVPVETGLVAEGWVEIASGLDGGEEVRLPG